MRPEDDPNRRFGNVEWWDDTIGRGRIIGDDGHVLSATYPGVRGTNILYENQRVSYIETMDMMVQGRKATKIMVVT